MKPDGKRQRDLARYERDLRSWLDANLTAPTDDDAALWATARDELRRRVPEATFDVWLEPVTLAGRLGADIALSAPEELAAWIRERLGDVLRVSFGGRRVRIVPALAAAAPAPAPTDQLAQRRAAA